MIYFSKARIVKILEKVISKLNQTNLDDITQRGKHIDENKQREIEEYIQALKLLGKSKEEINNEGYQISELMYCNRLLGKSYVCNVYRTDTETEINYLLDNTRTQITLQDLYDHAGYMDIHSDIEFNVKNDETYNNGYCTNLKTLLDRSGFMDDIYSTMGMIHVDFAITEGENTITGDDKILVSLMFGGIRIINTYTTRFKYEEDLNEIKMKYFLVRDINDLVWIVGYTESEEEFPKELKAQQLEMLHSRLMECTKVYEESKK